MLLVAPPTSQPTTSYSANLETFTSVGESYFALASQAGSNVADWATFPAVTDVDMSGNKLTQATTIQTAANALDICAGSVSVFPAGATSQVLLYDQSNNHFKIFSQAGEAYVGQTVVGGAPTAPGIRWLPSAITEFESDTFQPILQIQNVGNIVAARPIDLCGGKIYFYDASGQHLLESIDGNLYFDTELLAKASDIQDVADWALYPALADVDVDKQRLYNVGVLEIDTSGGSVVAMRSGAGALLDVSATTFRMVSTVPLSQVVMVDSSGTQLKLFSGGDTGYIGETMVGGTAIAPGIRFVTGKTTIEDASAQPIMDFNNVGSVLLRRVLDMCGNSIVDVSGVSIGLPGATGTLSTSAGGTVLNFNGSPITTGGGGSAANWSLYPALQTVDMSGNGLSQVTSLTNTQIAITADNGIDIGTPGKVDITGSNGQQGQVNVVANAGALGQNVGGKISLTANGGTLGPITYGGEVTIDANTGSLGSYGSATSAIKMSAAGINSYAGAIPSVGSLAGYNFIYGTGGVNICAGLPSVIPNIPTTTYVYGTGGVTLESGLLGDVDVKDSTLGALSIKPRTSALVNLGDLAITGRPNVLTPVQYVTLDMVKSIGMDASASITGVKTIGMSSGAITGVSTINGAPYPPVVVKDQTEFYVSTDGSNNYVGSITQPFQTIQYAINQASLVASSGNMAIINVSPGVYTENITITNGYITLASQATNENLAGQVRIAGTVTVTIGGSDDLFGKAVSFIGFQLGYVLDNSTAQHTLAFQNCYIFAGTGGTRVVYVNSTCTDQRVYMQNCSIQATAAATPAAIEINNATSCWLEMDKCDVVTAANIPCLLMSGASRIQRCALNAFTNNFATSNTMAPLISLNTTGLANSVGNNTFLFNTVTPQSTGNPNICGIFFGAATPTPPPGVFNLLAVMNYFVLTGTQTPQNNAIAKAGPNTPTVILYSNGSAPGLAYNVEAGITTATSNTVGFVNNVWGTFSSNVTQLVSNANIPTDISHNTIDVSSGGVDISSNGGIILPVAGDYLISISIQLDKSGGGTTSCDFWLRLNGVDIPRSASQVTVQGTNGETLANVTTISTATAGQVLTVVFASADNTMAATAFPAWTTPTDPYDRPAIPSIITTVRLLNP